MIRDVFFKPATAFKRWFLKGIQSILKRKTPETSMISRALAG
jgi:hypothetical protein